MGVVLCDCYWDFLFDGLEVLVSCDCLIFFCSSCYCFLSCGEWVEVMKWNRFLGFRLVLVFRVVCILLVILFVL